MDIKKVMGKYVIPSALSISLLANTLQVKKNNRDEHKNELFRNSIVDVMEKQDLFNQFEVDSLKNVISKYKDSQIDGYGPKFNFEPVFTENSNGKYDLKALVQDKKTKSIPSATYTIMKDVGKDVVSFYQDSTFFKNMYDQFSEHRVGEFENADEGFKFHTVHLTYHKDCESMIGPNSDESASQAYNEKNRLKDKLNDVNEGLNKVNDELNKKIGENYQSFAKRLNDDFINLICNTQNDFDNAVNKAYRETIATQHYK